MSKAKEVLSKGKALTAPAFIPDLKLKWEKKISAIKVAFYLQGIHGYSNTRFMYGYDFKYYKNHTFYAEMNAAEATKMQYHQLETKLEKQATKQIEELLKDYVRRK